LKPVKRGIIKLAPHTQFLIWQNLSKEGMDAKNWIRFFFLPFKPLGLSFAIFVVVKLT